MRKVLLSLVVLSALGLFAVGCQPAEEAAPADNATSDIATESAVDEPAPPADPADSAETPADNATAE